MSTLAKAANKYRNSKRNSQSFIESIAKRDYTNNSTDMKKYTTISINNDESYKGTLKNADNDKIKSFLSKFTKNAPTTTKEEKALK